MRLRAGNGGAGVVSFQRHGRHPKGRAVGGSGGPGGNVVVEADEAMSTLLTYKRNPHHSAGAGKHGRGDFQQGKRGDDLVLRVPLGTTIRDDDGTIVADLVEHGQSVVLVEGGRGGRGNAAFLSPQHRAPTFCEQGEYGPAEWFEFELRLVADAALIGFPNAGKSTLISRISAAKPKIADYPFTTLEPNLGVVSIADREFVVADVPGLIEGAAEGKGLGHDFLRHTERARALVVLLDPSPLQTDEVDRQYEVLIRELAAHSSELAARPRVVVVSKGDLPEAEISADVLRDLLGEPVHVISSVTGAGLTDLLHSIADAVDTAMKAAPEREGFMLHRPLATPFEITRVGDEWVVSGRAAERAVALNDLTQPDAAAVAARRLARIGVDEALRAAGAIAGDDVRIGDLVFEFDDDDA